MARIGFCLALLAAALASGCSEDEAPLDPATTECLSFELSGKSYRMRVPAGSSIDEDRSRSSVLIRPNPDGRLVRFLSLAPLAGATLPPPTESATLANDLTLSYSIDNDIGGGSGGPEAELLGETLLDVRTPVMIVCHDQHEGGANAEWCLDYLGTLAPVSSAETCK